LINRDRRGPLRGLVEDGGFKAFFEAHGELCCGTYRSEWARATWAGPRP
jgi:hypothetical protein